MAGSGCMHGTRPKDGTGTMVKMVDACFTPTVLHVAPGADVTFINRDDGIAHNVVGVGGTWGTLDNLSLGEQATYRFDANGVYLFSCFLHAGMIGAVVVGDGSAGADVSSVHADGSGITDADDGTKVAAAVTAGGASAPATTVVLVAALLFAGLVGLLVRARRRSMSSR
jgi:plastocyanin